MGGGGGEVLFLHRSSKINRINKFWIYSIRFDSTVIAATGRQMREAERGADLGRHGKLPPSRESGPTQ